MTAGFLRSSGLALVVLAAVILWSGDFFIDDDRSIHEANIDTLASNDITRGCEPGRFCPLDPVTRAQMASFLRRLVGLPESSADHFVDDESSVHEDDIDALFEAGITSGCGPRTYCPNGSITRGQVAAFLSRTMSLPQATSDYFEDDDRHLFEDEINRIAEAGLTRGCREGEFCPDRELSREELATLLVRAFDLRSETGTASPGENLAEPDIVLRPGDDVRSVVSASPEGTVFLFTAGRYSGASIEPKDDQVFIGERGAVLDGNGATEYAFFGHADDITITGFEITGYVPKIQHAPITAKTHEGQEGGDGWVVKYNEVHHNATAGISLSNRSVMRGNVVHHNGQIGVAVGWAPDGALVEDNEIYENNYEGLMEGWEDGGSKFAYTDGLVVRGNYVHDNQGPGLWTDIDNRNSVIANNVVVGNTRMGIYHEISYSAVIRDNIVEGNGLAKDDWLWGAGIAIAASQDVEVMRNVLSGNGNGISLIQQDRGEGAFGPYLVQDVVVHHNTLNLRPTAQVGGVQDLGDDAMFHQRNNRFHDNIYVVDDPERSYWTWDGRDLDFDGWLEFGPAVNDSVRSK